MQNGDIETQFAENSITPTRQPATLVAAESAQTDAESTTKFDTATATASVIEKSTSIQSGDSRLRSRLQSFWQRLRNQRREAAAVVVLLVMMIVWLDTGSSKTGSASFESDLLDGYESVLSDFEPVDDGEPKSESADPFESTSMKDFESGLAAVQTEVSVSTIRPPAASDGTSAAPTARYPEDTRPFDASANNSSTGNRADQQLSPRVKFAGRIKPSN